MRSEDVDDEELAVAIGRCRSWRGVLRDLGTNPTSAGLTRSLRRRADALGISYTHFTGQRRWSDSELAAAVAGSSSWLDVLEQLGLRDGGGSLASVRGHALRMSLATEHLAQPRPRPVSPLDAAPRLDLLRTAAGGLAAAWFQVRGYAVHWPQEPCRYDLIVEAGGTFLKIQVKTTTRRYGGTCLAMISTTSNEKRRAYDLDDVDHFFVVDDRLDAYLIPIVAVAGYCDISLRNYGEYLVAEAGNILRTPVSACASPAP